MMWREENQPDGEKELRTSEKDGAKLIYYSIGYNTHSIFRGPKHPLI